MTMMKKAMYMTSRPMRRDSECARMPRTQGRLLLQKRPKFKARYVTLGFMHEANPDEAAVWPSAFGLKELTAAEEENGEVGFIR